MAIIKDYIIYADILVIFSIQQRNQVKREIRK